eukprot:TRINITY_DN5765_c0_g1_i2.p1 TRINITY_DN5765_c0_g1~~TRINITY_DN5765_c0_g1_i2.p1  ORF type:complete len:559 (-),score=137.69 TRINITY_DN5765_c0_g1_i2:154-1830(-)
METILQTLKKNIIESRVGSVDLSRRSTSSQGRSVEVSQKNISEWTELLLKKRPVIIEILSLTRTFPSKPCLKERWALTFETPRNEGGTIFFMEDEDEENIDFQRFHNELQRLLQELPPFVESCTYSFEPTSTSHNFEGTPKMRTLPPVKTPEGNLCLSVTYDPSSAPKDPQKALSIERSLTQVSAPRRTLEFSPAISVPISFLISPSTSPTFPHFFNRVLSQPQRDAVALHSLTSTNLGESDENDANLRRSMSLNSLSLQSRVSSQFTSHLVRPLQSTSSLGNNRSLFPRPGTPTPPRSVPLRIPARPRPTSRLSKSLNGINVDDESPDSLSRSFPDKGRLTRSADHTEENEEGLGTTLNMRALCISPSEVTSFAGSFQESLISGRMSNTPASIYDGFIVDLGVSGKNYLPPHVKLPFTAIYYHIAQDTPYVGTIELDKKGYQVPEKGMIQLTIVNPTRTPIKTFLVKYDLEGMPTSSRTFVRQKITTSDPPILRYAVHLKFICPKKTKKKFYLYKNIRIVLAHRTPDTTEVLTTTYDVPSDPKYFYFTPKKSSSHRY